MKQSPEAALKTLQQTLQTLFLSTLSTDGQPNSSYAPYIMDDEGNFYIFISQLAAHTKDLLSHPQASILLIEDEQNAQQIFARQRVRYRCSCSVIDKEDIHYEALLDAFAVRFKQIIHLLRTLPDFVLFKLEIQSGHFVQGFGKAYTITPTGLIHQKN